MFNVQFEFSVNTFEIENYFTQMLVGLRDSQLARSFICQSKAERVLPTVSCVCLTFEQFVAVKYFTSLMSFKPAGDEVTWFSHEIFSGNPLDTPLGYMQAGQTTEESGKYFKTDLLLILIQTQRNQPHVHTQACS